MKIIKTDEITLGDVKKWIAKCKSIHGLQSIRAKTNKRIKLLVSPTEESPFKYIPISKKKEILKDLFI